MKLNGSAKLFLKRGTSFVLVICFLTTSVAWSAPLAPQLSPVATDLKKISIPETLGRVDELYLSESIDHESRLVIFIQDAHANLAAQKNISEIAAHLGKQLKIDAILKEGGSGEADLSELRSFPDQPVKNSVTDFWMKEAVLSGIERQAIIGNKSYRFFGIEEQKLYEQGSAYFVEAQHNSKSFLPALSFLHAKNKDNQKNVFNPDLLRFEELVEKFESKHELIPLVELIANEARNLHINRWKYLEIEKFIDLILAEMNGERSERIFEIQKTLDSKKLFSEIELLKAEVKGALFQNKKERILDREAHFLNVLKSMVSLEATTQDFGFFEENKKSIEKYLNKRKLDSKAIEPAEKFYESARERDLVLFSNINEILKTQNVKRAFLVAGGFHTQNITEQFRKHKISYAVITPQVSDENNFESYFARIAGKRAALDDFKSRYLPSAVSSTHAAPAALLNPIEVNAIVESIRWAERQRRVGQKRPALDSNLSMRTSTSDVVNILIGFLLAGPSSFTAQFFERTQPSVERPKVVLGSKRRQNFSDEGDVQLKISDINLNLGNIGFNPPQPILNIFEPFSKSTKLLMDILKNYFELAFAGKSWIVFVVFHDVPFSAGGTKVGAILANGILQVKVKSTRRAKIRTELSDKDDLLDRLHQIQLEMEGAGGLRAEDFGAPRSEARLAQSEALSGVERAEVRSDLEDSGPIFIPWEDKETQQKSYLIQEPTVRLLPGVIPEPKDPEFVYRDILKELSSSRSETRKTPVVVVMDRMDEKELEKQTGITEIKNVNALQGQEKIDEMVRLNPDILIVRGSTVTPSLIARLTNLKEIIRAGHGTDNIDVGVDKLERIKVKKTGGSEEPVAALTMRMLARAAQGDVTSPVDQAPASLYTIPEWQEAFDKKLKTVKGAGEKTRLTQNAAEIFQPLSEATINSLKGKIIGTIGFGTIGKQIAAVAKALGMEVLVYSPSLWKNSSALASLGYHLADKEAIYRSAHFIVPMTGLQVTGPNRNLKMIDRTAVDLMAQNPNLIALINADRKELVDEEALVGLIQSGKLQYLLDEIPETDFMKKHALYTPHVGASTTRGEGNVVSKTAEVLKPVYETLAKETAARAEVRTEKKRPKPVDDKAKRIINEILFHYKLGTVQSVKSLMPQFTAKPRLLAKVTMSDGSQYVVKENDGFEEKVERLKYLYWTQNNLARHGFETPRIYRTQGGRLFVEVGDFRYVVMDYIKGVQGTWNPPLHQRVQAAQFLAKLHFLLQDKTPPGEPNQMGFYDEFELNRYRMETLLSQLKTRGPPYNDVEQFILQHASLIRYHFKEASQNLPRSVYERLSKTVIHGDYAPVNMVISGKDARKGDVVAVIDFRPAHDARVSRDFVTGFETPLSDENSSMPVLARFAAVYQAEAGRLGVPLTAEEIVAIPEIYRISRLRLISWLGEEGKIASLMKSLSEGDRGRFDFYQYPVKDLEREFGTEASPLRHDNFPNLVDSFLKTYDPSLSLASRAEVRKKYPSPVPYGEHPWVTEMGYSPSVPFTFLLRYPAQLKFLRDQVFPKIFSRQGKSKHLKISFLGVSTGEEIASVFYALKKAYEKHPEWGRLEDLRLTFIANDYDQADLDEALHRIKGDRPFVYFEDVLNSIIPVGSPPFSYNKTTLGTVVKTVQKFRDKFIQSIHFISGDLFSEEVQHETKGSHIIFMNAVPIRKKQQQNLADLKEHWQKEKRRPIIFTSEQEVTEDLKGYKVTHEAVGFIDSYMAVPVPRRAEVREIYENSERFLNLVEKARELKPEIKAIRESITGKKSDPSRVEKLTKALEDLRDELMADQIRGLYQVEEGGYGKSKFILDGEKRRFVKTLQAFDRNKPAFEILILLQTLFQLDYDLMFRARTASRAEVPPGSDRTGDSSASGPSAPRSEVRTEVGSGIPKLFTPERMKESQQLVREILLRIKREGKLGILAQFPFHPAVVVGSWAATMISQGRSLEWVHQHILEGIKDLESTIRRKNNILPFYSRLRGDIKEANSRIQNYFNRPKKIFLNPEQVILVKGLYSKRFPVGAIAYPLFNRIVLKESTVRDKPKRHRVSVLIHEALHLSAVGLIPSTWMNEGMTELITRRMLPVLQNEHRVTYDEEVHEVEALIERFGLKPILQAYLVGDYEFVQRILDLETFFKYFLQPHNFSFGNRQIIYLQYLFTLYPDWDLFQRIDAALALESAHPPLWSNARLSSKKYLTYSGHTAPPLEPYLLKIKERYQSSKRKRLTKEEWESVNREISRFRSEQQKFIRLILSGVRKPSKEPARAETRMEPERLSWRAWWETFNAPTNAWKAVKRALKETDQGDKKVVLGKIYAVINKWVSVRRDFSPSSRSIFHKDHHYLTFLTTIAPSIVKSSNRIQLDHFLSLLYYVASSNQNSYRVDRIMHSIIEAVYHPIPVGASRIPSTRFDEGAFVALSNLIPRLVRQYIGLDTEPGLEELAKQVVNFKRSNTEFEVIKHENIPAQYHYEEREGTGIFDPWTRYRFHEKVIDEPEVPEWIELRAISRAEVREEKVAEATVTTWKGFKRVINGWLREKSEAIDYAVLELPHAGPEGINLRAMKGVEPSLPVARVSEFLKDQIKSYSFDIKPKFRLTLIKIEGVERDEFRLVITSSPRADQRQVSEGSRAEVRNTFEKIMRLQDTKESMNWLEIKLYAPQENGFYSIVLTPYVLSKEEDSENYKTHSRIGKRTFIRTRTKDPDKAEAIFKQIVKEAQRFKNRKKIEPFGVEYSTFIRWMRNNPSARAEVRTDPDQESLKSFLMSKLEKKGWNQNRLAKVIRRNRSQVTRFFNQETVPDLDTSLVMGEVLDFDGFGFFADYVLPQRQKIRSKKGVDSTFVTNLEGALRSMPFASSIEIQEPQEWKDTEDTAGQFIIQKREAKRMNQMTLAKNSGIHKGTLSQIEHNLRLPNLEQSIVLGKLLEFDGYSFHRFIVERQPRKTSSRAEVRAILPLAHIEMSTKMQKSQAALISSSSRSVTQMRINVRYPIPLRAATRLSPMISASGNLIETSFLVGLGNFSLEGLNSLRYWVESWVSQNLASSSKLLNFGILDFLDFIRSSPFLSQLFFSFAHISGRQDANNSFSTIPASDKQVPAIERLAIDQIASLSSSKNKRGIAARFFHLFGVHPVTGYVVDVLLIPFKSTDAQLGFSSPSSGSIDVYTKDVKFPRAETRSHKRESASPLFYQLAYQLGNLNFNGQVNKRALARELEHSLSELFGERVLHEGRTWKHVKPQDLEIEESSHSFELKILPLKEGQYSVFISEPLEPNHVKRENFVMDGSSPPEETAQFEFLLNIPFDSISASQAVQFAVPQWNLDEEGENIIVQTELEFNPANRDAKRYEIFAWVLNHRGRDGERWKLEATELVKNEKGVFAEWKIPLPHGKPQPLRYTMVALKDVKKESEFKESEFDDPEGQSYSSYLANLSELIRDAKTFSLASSKLREQHAPIWLNHEHRDQVIYPYEIDVALAESEKKRKLVDDLSLIIKGKSGAQEASSRLASRLKNLSTRPLDREKALRELAELPPDEVIQKLSNEQGQPVGIPLVEVLIRTLFPGRFPEINYLERIYQRWWFQNAPVDTYASGYEKLEKLVQNHPDLQKLFEDGELQYHETGREGMFLFSKKIEESQVFIPFNFEPNPNLQKVWFTVSANEPFLVEEKRKQRQQPEEVVQDGQILVEENQEIEAVQGQTQQKGSFIQVYNPKLRKFYPKLHRAGEAWPIGVPPEGYQFLIRQPVAVAKAGIGNDVSKVSVFLVDLFYELYKSLNIDFFITRPGSQENEQAPRITDLKDDNQRDALIQFFSDRSGSVRISAASMKANKATLKLALQLLGQILFFTKHPQGLEDYYSFEQAHILERAKLLQEFNRAQKWGQGEFSIERPSFKLEELLSRVQAVRDLNLPFIIYVTTSQKAPHDHFVLGSDLLAQAKKLGINRLDIQIDSKSEVAFGIEGAASKKRIQEFVSLLEKSLTSVVPDTEFRNNLENLRRQWDQEDAEETSKIDTRRAEVRAINKIETVDTSSRANQKKRMIVSLKSLKENRELRSELKKVLETNRHNKLLEVVIFAPEYENELQAEDLIIEWFGPTAFIKLPLQLRSRKGLKLFDANLQRENGLNRLVVDMRDEVAAKGFSTRVVIIDEEGVLSKVARRDTPKLLARPEALRAALLLFELDGAIDWFKVAGSAGILNPTQAIINSLQQSIMAQFKQAIAA